MKTSQESIVQLETRVRQVDQEKLDINKQVLLMQKELEELRDCKQQNEVVIKSLQTHQTVRPTISRLGVYDRAKTGYSNPYRTPLEQEPDFGQSSNLNHRLPDHSLTKTLPKKHEELPEEFQQMQLNIEPVVYNPRTPQPFT